MIRDLVAGTRALRFERDPPERIDAIVIVGSTCAGKTTLVDAVRRSAPARVDIPCRWVTRPARADDVPAEAHYATSAELDAALASGVLGLHWSRVLGNGRTERYAFAAPAPGTLPLYSANNAIYIPGNIQPPLALAHALLVGVFAPDEIRARRLEARSPALLRDCPDEARARIAESATTMLGHVHVVIENHGGLEPVAKVEILRLVDAVLQAP